VEVAGVLSDIRKHKMKRYTGKEIRILEKQTLECKDVEALFDSFIDDELNPTLKARIASHITTCEECAEFAASYKLVTELAKEIRPEPTTLPRDVKFRLHQTLNEKLGLTLPVGEA